METHTITVDKDFINAINKLADLALRGSGLEALSTVSLVGDVLSRAMGAQASPLPVAGMTPESLPPD